MVLSGRAQGEADPHAAFLAQFWRPMPSATPATPMPTSRTSNSPTPEPEGIVPSSTGLSSTSTSSRSATPGMNGTYAPADIDMFDNVHNANRSRPSPGPRIPTLLLPGSTRRRRWSENVDGGQRLPNPVHLLRTFAAEKSAQAGLSSEQVAAVSEFAEVCILFPCFKLAHLYAFKARTDANAHSYSD